MLTYFQDIQGWSGVTARTIHDAPRHDAPQWTVNKQFRACIYIGLLYVTF